MFKLVFFNYNQILKEVFIYWKSDFLLFGNILLIFELWYNEFISIINYKIKFNFIFWVEIIAFIIFIIAVNSCNSIIGLENILKGLMSMLCAIMNPLVFILTHLCIVICCLKNTILFLDLRKSLGIWIVCLCCCDCHFTKPLLW